jgi:hypothetical protein
MPTSRVFFTDSDLRQAVRAPGGRVLQERSRTSWDYPPEIREAIKGLQTKAQNDGTAQRLTSTHIVITQAGT